MQAVTIDTGSDSYARLATPVDDGMFGVRYLSYHSLDRFAEQIADLDAGLIVWPGGTLAEQRTDRYGFEHEDFYNPSTGKPGLTEMLAFAVENDCDFSMVIPTARYIDDVETLQAEVAGFVDSLVSGVYGPLPDRVILEVGNEYYANFPNDSAGAAAAHYGAIAEIVISEIATVLASYSDQTAADGIKIAVQSGKTLADDDIIRDSLSDMALENVDLVLHHHFPWDVSGVDDRVARVEDMMQEWTTDKMMVGAEPPDLFMSSWNVATVTRAGVLQDFLASGETELTAEDVDLQGRTTTEFEEYWQNELSQLDYGIDHAGMVLEMFSSYARIGMEAGAIYGTDSVQPGRLSVNGTDGQGHDFVGHEMYEMLAESVRGCTPLDEEESAGRGLRVYAFENDDKLVVFLAADDRVPEPVSLGFAAGASDFLSVSADSLHGEIDPDWMTIYGVTDNPDVDETAEAWTYATPIVEGVETDVSAGRVTVDFTHPDQVIRLAFAKTAEGQADIASWTEGVSSQIILEEASIPEVPIEDVPPETEPEPEAEDEGGFDFLFLLFGLFLGI